MTINKGDLAPDFTLVGDDKQNYTLHNVKDKNIILLFFPFAFTGVCTKELCAVRDDLKYYEGLDAQIFGISVDSPFTLAKFKEEQNYNFPLLSDFNKIVSKTYGAYYDIFALGLEGVSKRAAFVIDKSGKIAYAEVLENAGDIPNFPNIKTCLEGLQ